VVWIVSPESDPNPLVVAGVPFPQTLPGYQEQTAGSFGQTAGSVGQTAGSVGQTTGSFGQTSGSTGQSAGSTGQTAGSFGRSASTVGRNAGDAGRTMADFGVSTTGLAGAAAAANAPLGNREAPRRGAGWDGFLNVAQQEYSALRITYVDIYRNDLTAALQITAGTTQAPDLLLGSPLPPEWTRADGLARKLGSPIAWTSLRVAQTEDGYGVGAFHPEAAVLANAPDSQAAQAFYLWFADRGAEGHRGIVVPPAQRLVAELAMRATREVLGGQVPDDADAQMARFSADAMNAMLMGQAGGAGEAHTDITALQVFDTLGVAAVRATTAGGAALGVAHAVVVLRKDDAGRWHVLQISPNLAPELQAQAWQTLVRYAEANAPAGMMGSAALVTEGYEVKGIAAPSPGDGENRTAQPELGWDNRGGSTLQVVEWQRELPEGWTGTNLFFVPDNNMRLRTRVTARFAVALGKYRWRVWSVGRGGKMLIGAWRTINIVGG
jgi:hypothetical protein